MKLAVLLFAFAVQGQGQDANLEYVKRELVGKYGLGSQEVDSVFADPRLAVYPRNTLISRGLSWREYTKLILSDSSVRAGRTFFNEHREVFDEANRRYGVEGEYLTSLFRIETNFGQNLGEYVVLNVFFTEVLTSPRHSVRAWAAENLIALLLYCLVYEIDCYEIRGSRAGAFGLPQFLPSTLVEYAVDADGDGRENLFSLRDAVMSAANYLAASGWHKNKAQALARYYGSSHGYPSAIERYASVVGGAR